MCAFLETLTDLSRISYSLEVLLTENVNRIDLFKRLTELVSVQLLLTGSGTCLCFAAWFR